MWWVQRTGAMKQGGAKLQLLKGCVQYMITWQLPGLLASAQAKHASHMCTSFCTPTPPPHMRVHADSTHDQVTSDK